MRNLPVLNLDNTQAWRRLRAIVIVAASLVVITLTGCGGVSEPTAESQDVAVLASTPTEVPSGTAVIPTPTLNYKELAFVHEDETEVAIRTEVALTAAPTWTPGVPPPGPSATPILGLDFCANANALEPYMLSCWVGIYNGDIVDVRSGREGRAGDVTQGLIFVLNRSTNEWHYYPTPNKSGTVQITSINGTLFTLVAGDHSPPITYTFDLATRQWVNPPLTPSPSIPPLPTLTASP